MNLPTLVSKQALCVANPAIEPRRTPAIQPYIQRLPLFRPNGTLQQPNLIESNTLLQALIQHLDDSVQRLPPTTTRLCFEMLNDRARGPEALLWPPATKRRRAVVDPRCVRYGRCHVLLQCARIDEGRSVGTQAAVEAGGERERERGARPAGGGRREDDDSVVVGVAVVFGAPFIINIRLDVFISRRLIVIFTSTLLVLVLVLVIFIFFFNMPTRHSHQYPDWIRRHHSPIHKPLRRAARTPPTLEVMYERRQRDKRPLARGTRQVFTDGLVDYRRHVLLVRLFGTELPLARGAEVIVVDDLCSSGGDGGGGADANGGPPRRRYTLMPQQRRLASKLSVADGTSKLLDVATGVLSMLAQRMLAAEVPIARVAVVVKLCFGVLRQRVGGFEVPEAHVAFKHDECRCE